MDRTELFHHPVNRLEVPDYFEVIKEPMCWLWIDEKLEENKYRDAQEFVVSLNLGTTLMIARHQFGLRQRHDL